MNITAKIIQDSISPDGVRITTMELEYPRFIHSEFMTHRVFSRNAASSRAIPIAKMIEQVRNRPAKPVEWGANQAGMQAGEEVLDAKNCEFIWNMAAKSACQSAENLQSLGLHKQIVNRVLEPFQTMKTVVTATEWDNFFELRNHKDAQPEIQVLARIMADVMYASKPMQLDYGEWHTPYVERKSDDKGKLQYLATEMYEEDGIMQPTTSLLTEEQALMVSASCCAQVSYRLLDDSLEKAVFVYDKLVNSRPIHASPFEHQGTPLCQMMGEPEFSGNLRGWLQYRKTLEV